MRSLSRIEGGRLMLKRLLLGGALTWTVLCGAAIANVLLQSNTTPESRRGIVLASTVLGGLGLASSGLLTASLKRQRQSERRSQLHQAFMQQLSQGQGQVALMPFALAAQVDAAEARAFLDRQAVTFDAEFGVTEEGEVIYSFQRSLAEIAPASLS